MHGYTPHEQELAADDHGVTANILQQFANAVRDMQATPAIRLSPYMRIEIQHSAASIAEVDAIAAGLGVTPEWNEERTHYTATRHYGQNVTYAVVYITREHMAAYTAHWKDFPRDAGAAPVSRELAGSKA